MVANVQMSCLVTLTLRYMPIVILAPGQGSLSNYSFLFHEYELNGFYFYVKKKKRSKTTVGLVDKSVCNWYMPMGNTNYRDKPSVNCDCIFEKSFKLSKNLMQIPVGVYFAD